MEERAANEEKRKQLDEESRKRQELENRAEKKRMPDQAKKQQAESGNWRAELSNVNKLPINSQSSTSSDKKMLKKALDDSKQMGDKTNRERW